MTKVRYSEADVTAQVVDYFLTLGIVLERRNTGAARYPNRDGSERIVRYGAPGDSDWTGIIPTGPHEGKRIDVEMKATGEKPTMVQFDRLVRTNQAGGIGVVFDSLESAMAVMPHVIMGAKVQFLDVDQIEVYYTGDVPGHGPRFRPA